MAVTVVVVWHASAARKETGIVLQLCPSTALLGATADIHTISLPIVKK